MTRGTAIAGHLPSLYREGELVGALTGNWGVQLDGLDEAAVSVQRAHWFDATPSGAEAAALAALLDIRPEDFHANVAEFRAWVHALRDGALTEGSVTREALRVLVDRYCDGFQRAAGIDLLPPVTAWASAPGEGAALVENPGTLRSARLPASGGLEPLARVVVRNAGLDPAPWAVVLTGTEGGDEYAPLLANRTTGDALVFRGRIGLGQSLTVAPRADDRTLLRAELDGTDVTDRLDVYPALVPGPDGPGTAEPPPLTLRLARGDNELWFVPLAHHDTPGLGRFLLALAEDTLHAGHFDETVFDRAVFAQRPEVAARVAWVENTPAALEIVLPAHALRTAAGSAAAGIAARDRLEAGLDRAVERAAAAGVRTEVTMGALAERQPGRDRLAALSPTVLREVGPTGADRLAESAGTFGVSGYDDSTLT